MQQSEWITVQYDDFGEIINPEYVAAKDDSWWWYDDRTHHRVVQKTHINNRVCWPRRIARVMHPSGVDES
jgi:hypothetical protein